MVDFNPGARELFKVLTEINRLPHNVRGRAWQTAHEAAEKSSTGENHAGATVNVNNFRMAEDGTPDTFVGGEKDTTGKPVKTEFVGAGEEKPSVSPLSVLQHAARVRTLMGGKPNANVGFWLDPDNRHLGSQVDASAGYPDEDAAIEAMKDRPAEHGAWSMRKGFIPNPAYDENKDPKSENYKGE